MLSASPRHSPPTPERTTPAIETTIPEKSQAGKRKIKELADDTAELESPIDEQATRIQPGDSLLERLRGAKAQQKVNSTSDPARKSPSSPRTMETESTFENSLAQAIARAHTEAADEDPSQSTRRVKPRLEHQEPPVNAPGGSSGVVDGDSEMAGVSDSTNGQGSSAANGDDVGNPVATGSKRPLSPNPDRSTGSGTVEQPADASADARSAEQHGSPASPPATRRRRKVKDVEATEPSPARQTRSRARTANSAAPSNAPSTSNIVLEDQQSNGGASKAPEDTTMSPSATTADANIDPALTAESASNKQPAVASAAASPSQPSTNGSTTKTSSTSSGGVNPYLSLFFPKTNPNGGTPTPTSAHPIPFANPYMFYPMTPVTPNSPGYPYNPYLYMGAPMMPGYHHPAAPQPAASSPATPSSSAHPAPPQPAQAQAQPAAPPAPKPKRTKAHPVSSKSFSIPLVPRDKQGKPMLPLNVGIMTVISLGTVCPREHFHTERYIFPVGYEVTRRYLSTINRNIEVVYHCTILDGGDGPKFQIVPSDAPDKPVIAGTATGAWSSIVKQANAIRSRQHSNSVSGPDFFGLGQNTIKHLIQELPGADKLKNYVWQYFIEGGPLGGRHASVIPALPEEYDASIPRGPVYHTPLEREKMKMVADANVSPGEMPKGLSHYPQHIIAQAQGGPPQAGPSQPLPPLRTSAPAAAPPPTPPPGAPVPTAGLPTIPSIMAVNPNTLPPAPSPCSIGAQPTPPPSSTPQPQVTHHQHVPTQRPSASAQLQQIQAQVQAAHAHQSPSSASTSHAATFIPNVGQPTPITPNTPAPSIASIMNAYRPAAS